MTPTQLRAKLEAKHGRPLNVSDARLAELIEEARRRKAPPAPPGPMTLQEWPPPRRLPDNWIPGIPGISDAHWTNEALEYPHGIDRGPEGREEGRRIAEQRAARARHPSAGTPTEFETPDLHLVPSEPDGPPTYARHEEAG
jgi:hypothetical protein